jgi:hypothetical protein
MQLRAVNNLLTLAVLAALTFTPAARASNPLQVKTDKGKVEGALKAFPSLRLQSVTCVGSLRSPPPNGKTSAPQKRSAITACRQAAIPT